MRASCHSLDRFDVTFDDERLVANAGLMLPATLAQHLGLRELFDEHVDLGDAAGRANVGHKAMTLVHSALVGGDSIDDADVLRSGGTEAVLGHGVLAPSTLGTFLRSLQLGPCPPAWTRWLASCWSGLGRRGRSGPRSRSTIDVDSTIRETYGLSKQGGVFGHYHGAGLSPAGGRHGRHRRRGALAPARRQRPLGPGSGQLPHRDVQPGARRGGHGTLTLRADSGFYNRKVVDACGRPACASRSRPSCTRASKCDRGHRRVRLGAHPLLLRRRRRGRDHLPALRHQGPAARLIVRRVRPTPGSQLALFAEFSYHAFITDRDGATLELEADHRRHADVEDAIRDLKYGVGLNHMPSGRFGANAAWLGLNVIAHNLARFSTRLGLGRDDHDRHPSPPLPEPAGTPHPSARRVTCTCRRVGPGRSASSLRSPVTATSCS